MLPQTEKPGVEQYRKKTQKDVILTLWKGVLEALLLLRLVHSQKGENFHPLH